ncbi:MAG TPA: hypothetical protein VL689_18505 [Paraburkholderia sp.]|jgi:hypothetical protein|nr:hypothetical protein [Paraburkholderia sp.]
MNLQDQIGALESGVDQLIKAVDAALAASPADDSNSAAHPSTDDAALSVAASEPAARANATAAETIAVADEVATAEASAPAEPPTLQIGRPSQNEITMTIGGQTVSLHPLQVGQLVEELANARASMTPETPPDIPPGWRFVATKNPVMAVQKQSNGDRLLVLRHTGHGWVPFTFSPDMVIQMYMMLTQR